MPQSDVSPAHVSFSVQASKTLHDLMLLLLMCLTRPPVDSDGLMYCAAYVRQGSVLDGEARARGTTVYLVDRRLDMLPGPLSEDAASLLAGVDRLAVSALWRLGRDMTVKSVWFGRTVIRCSSSSGQTSASIAPYQPIIALKTRQLCFQTKFLRSVARRVPISANQRTASHCHPCRSRYQLSYQQAQDVLDGRRPAPGHEVAAADREQLRRALTLLKDVTDNLRARRQEASAGVN